MTIKNRLSAAGLALLFALLLPLLLPVGARAEWTQNTETNRFNTVLVVDKSGSLVCENGTGTDPDGLRYDALRMFLGLMTEKGNRIGAIVFDEFIRYEAAPELLEGMEAKKALIEKIEEYYPEYDTDIGRAMLRATELLRGMEEQNGQPGMILLFSDGMTDFTTGDLRVRYIESYGFADQALERAREDGVTINGILLNVDDAAESDASSFAAEGFRLYTGSTGGEFEQVKKPEDLTNAFRRLYHIVNNTDYTGEKRVSFSDSGEAEIYFTVPSFGVEEVNLIVEGERLHSESGVSMEILSPAGEPFEIDGHALDSARYQLVKIPDPSIGVWTVRLKGEPDNWVDVTEVYNASFRVELNSDDDVYAARANTPYAFTVTVLDPAAPALTAEQLGGLRAVLTREELATGAVREYELAFWDGAFRHHEPVTFPKPGEYRVSAAVGFGDFQVVDDWEILVEPTPLIAAVDEITDMLEYGRFRDDRWELPLPQLFGLGEGSELRYTLSDDYDGAVYIENGLLAVTYPQPQSYSFTLTVEDQTEQSAWIDFELSAPGVEAAVGQLTDLREMGFYHDGRWEAELDELFEDPKGCPLEYELSNDCDGAVVIEDGMLRVFFGDEARPLSFTLTATDLTKQSAKTTFDLAVPTVNAKLDRISNMMTLGQLQDFRWELPLSGLFYDDRDMPLEYALSDDCGSAVTLSDGMLRVDFHTLREAAFDLTATNPYAQRAVIPVSLRLPGPAASVGEITETVKTGLFQEDVWEQRLDSLFSEPKGTAMTYTLSDDLGGAAVIENGLLRVNMKGLKTAAFSLRVTDGYGLQSEIPITLKEKNMTLVYLLWSLPALLVAGVPAGVVLYRRRQEQLT